MRSRERERHLIRLLNPHGGQGRKRNLVRLLNPATLPALLNSESPETLFTEFRGREPRSVQVVEAMPGTPKTVAELGGLIEITLDGETIRKRLLALLGLRVETNEHGEGVWQFDYRKVKLAADGDGNLHILGYYIPPPASLQSGRSYYVGEVVTVTYRADKNHLDPGVNNYVHEFAEMPSDEPPGLYYKGGFLYFRGGTYTITKWGIEG